MYADDTLLYLSIYLSLFVVMCSVQREGRGQKTEVVCKVVVVNSCGVVNQGHQ